MPSKPMQNSAYKIVNLKQSVRYPNMWNFSIAMQGFVFNGFVFVPANGERKAAVLRPKLPSGRVLVNAFGIQWKRLINQLNALVEEQRKIL